MGEYLLYNARGLAFEFTVEDYVYLLRCQQFVFCSDQPVTQTNRLNKYGYIQFVGYGRDNEPLFTITPRGQDALTFYRDRFSPKLVNKIRKSQNRKR